MSPLGKGRNCYRRETDANQPTSLKRELLQVVPKESALEMRKLKHTKVTSLESDNHTPGNDQNRDSYSGGLIQGHLTLRSDLARLKETSPTPTHIWDEDFL